jgi:1-acyl-sn-glycerol-3-phosphate acyltransferase
MSRGSTDSTVGSGPWSAARRAYRITGFVGLTAAMLPLYAVREVLTAPSARESVRDRWIGRWSSALLRLFSISVRTEGLPLTREAQRGRLVVSNHRSAIDIGLLLRAFGGHMVSRADLAGWPLLGRAARKIGTVFVDRSSTVSGASAIRAMRQILSAHGTVLLFPEGTTFEGDVVRPFHPGGFIAALRTGAEIVPVGIAYERGSRASFVGETFVRHLSRMAGGPPTRVVMRVGAPIAVAPDVRATVLAEQSHAAVQALVTEARAACDGPGA